MTSPSRFGAPPPRRNVPDRTRWYPWFMALAWLVLVGLALLALAVTQ